MRLSHLVIFWGIVALLFCFCQYLLEVYMNDNEDHWMMPTYNQDFSKFSFKDVAVPVIIWWASIKGLKSEVRQCGQQSCFFTDFRHFQNHSQFKGFMFYGTLISWTDIPLPRNGTSIFWALIHEESPRNNIALSHEDVISLFNYTATFSRYSNFPLTTQYLWDLESLTDTKYFENTNIKNNYQKNDSLSLAPVIFLQSDCSTSNDRDSYVAELSKYIRVDSYGSCLHNRDLPGKLGPPWSFDTLMSEELLHFVGKYKFMLSIENGICEDYITEKLWRPLMTGTVPIYIGSPSVTDWLPNNQSAILGLDFDSPKCLAKYLHHLNAHDEEYNRYLHHKIEREVTNTHLVQVMNARRFDTPWKSHNRGDFIRNFECYICQKAYRPDYNITVASKQHYNCPMPVSILSRKINKTNEWLDSWFFGHCEAKAVRMFVDSGVSNFTDTEFHDVVQGLQTQNKCGFSEKNTEDINIP